MKMIEVSEDALNSIKAMAEKLQGERDMLLAALKFQMQTKWKSVDKDNMEFSGIVTCYQLDAIREAIKKAEAEPPNAGNKPPQVGLD